MTLPLTATAEQRAEWCAANGLQVGWLLFTEEEMRSLRKTQDDLFPHPSKTDWVPCPVCGEPDMLRQEDDEGNPLILCVNHCCASNGGSNHDAIKGNSLHDVLNEAALHEEIGQLKAIIALAQDQLRAEQTEIGEAHAALNVAGVPTNGAQGRGKRQELSLAQRITELRNHSKFAAAYQIVALIRPRVRDEVKDGRGTMAVFDRARMEALAKALAAFDGA